MSNDAGKFIEGEAKAYKNYASNTPYTSYPENIGQEDKQADQIENILKQKAKSSEKAKDIQSLISGAFLHASYRDFCDRYAGRIQIYANGIDQILKFDTTQLANINLAPTKEK